MSKVRYFIAIGVSLAVMAIVSILLTCLTDGAFQVWMAIIVAYFIGALVGDLILYYEGLPLRVCVIILSWIPRIYNSWHYLVDDISGFTITIILAIILILPGISLVIAVFMIALILPIIISAVTFIVHLITFAQDLY
jgi:hypothetical protein